MVDVYSERNSELRTDDESHPPRVHVSEAVRIVEVSDEDPDHAFTLNEAALERVLLDRKYADKKVAVIGVAGAYRKGKSFLLNFFLRYLQALEQNKGDEWLQPDAPLKGFSWRGGSERETNGILIWERPFLIRDQNGEEIAVLLMDTQGAFDSQSTVKDCATIFALSTMISSIQIYNLTQNIQEDDLQHLQLFTEYGRLALESSTNKPFQSLIFLVRDWSFPYEAEYGFQGGQRTLDKRLQLSDKQHPELQQLRKHIRSCFDKIECFLMPHPGLKVATNPNFDGKLADIQIEFQQSLQAMIPRLLDGANLVIKDIAGHKVTCRELVEYFKAYMKIFQGQELPEPKSMLIATAEANNLAAVSSARALYIKNMEEICGGEKPYMQTAELANEHERCRSEAIREFRNAKKMGGADFSITFLERLETDINDSYESFKKSNEGKNLFKSMRTPAVLIAIMIADYVLQEFCQLLGMNSIAGIFSSVFLIIVCTLSVWAYSRYSGNLREPAGYIDDSVNWVWKEFISPNAHHMGALGGAVQLGDQLQNATASARRAAPSASRDRKDR